MDTVVLKMTDSIVLQIWINQILYVLLMLKDDYIKVIIIVIFCTRLV